MLPASLRALVFAPCIVASFARPAPAQDLPATIATLTSKPEVARANWGIMVTAMDGTPIYALNEKKLFQPASNAKLFTTAAALALLGSSSTFETRVVAEGSILEGTLKGNLLLLGDGEPNISARQLPYLSPAMRPKMQSPSSDPLSIIDDLAAKVAASGVRTIDGDIIGDDTLFPWEPYPIDWSVDDLVWGYGAPVSALTINDNQLKLTLSPGVLPKITSAREIIPPTRAIVNLQPALAYYTIDNQTETTEAKTKSSIGIDRAVGSRTLRLFGTIAADSTPDVEEIAIDDPAEFAAAALRTRLLAHGVVVKGSAVARHRLSKDSRPFLEEAREPLPEINDRSGPGIAPCLRCRANLRGDALASHRSATVAEDVVVTNKVSQNLHAELLLHQLSIAFSDDPDAGSTAQGARVIRQFAVNAGVNADDFIFYDGSGMSGHDLVTPRAIVKLLQFASTQPWFADYKTSLPVGGVDGSLELRFIAPPLKGHVIAKTGTNSETRALSGYLECASGRTVIFSILVGNHAPGPPVDRDVMDKIVAAIADAD